MKIRIQGNSIRLRLTKSEVESLASSGFAEEHTDFGKTRFTYRIEISLAADYLSAGFENNTIVLTVPSGFAKTWPANDIISLQHIQEITQGRSLHLLLEKDFKCLTRTTEDQSEQYDNPEKNC